MALVTTKQMLLDAQAGGYAVGAFNTENMEMVQAVIAAAEQAKAPVILQTTPSTLQYAPPAMFFAMAQAAAKNASVEVALHLDHGSSFGLAMQTIREGYTSVMIDGSREPLEENISLTRQVTAAAHPCGLPVEAELGKVGGKEDSLVSDGDRMTDPADAVRFVRETEVDSLAVAIGTAHGVYRSQPHLDVERLSAIRRAVDVPLVLHGASGLSEQDVRECVARGICKVNFATELRIAFSDAVKKLLAEKPEVFDPKKYGAPAREAVIRQVLDRMRMCGCCGKNA